MRTVLAWLATLVAMLTSLAMLKDTDLGRDQRADLRRIGSAAWLTLRTGGPCALAPPEVSRPIRFVLRALVLGLIAATSGVSLLMVPTLDPYSALLRCALVTHLAMQAPCPWLRWITCGLQHTSSAGTGKADPHVH